MDRDDSKAGVLAAIVAVGSLIAVLVFKPWRKGDGDGDDAKRATLDDKPSDDTGGGDLILDAKPAFIASTAKCGSTPYNLAEYPTPERAAEDLRKLGYAVPKLPAAGAAAEQVRAAQRRFRALKLPGMKGKSDAWIDAKVGPCTLVAMSAAMKMYREGKWPGP